MLLTVPLFALYEVGLLVFTEGRIRNAAEVLLLGWLGIPVGRRASLLLNGAVLLLFLLALLVRRRRPPAPGLALVVLIESFVYAVLLAPVTTLFRDLASLAAGGASGGMIENLVLGLGAGLYEELLFRLVLIAGGYVVLRRLLHVDPVWAQVLLVITSALLFSAFHHMGSLGEPWDPGVFVFRFLAGVFLGILYAFRGLAVACWTHALYDVLWALGG